MKEVVLLAIAAILLLAYSHYYSAEVDPYIYDEIQILKRKVDSLDRKHTLYLEHLEKCSFIDNESVEVGHDNYLRKKKIMGDRK